jgi:hypothetical protein
MKDSPLRKKCALVSERFIGRPVSRSAIDCSSAAWLSGEPVNPAGTLNPPEAFGLFPW